MVRVESLDFGYVKSAPLTLRDVNLNLEAGAMLTILGQNGAGKSTLLNLISGTLTPLRGKISIDGKDMASLGAKGRAEIIGYVSQSEVCEYDYSVFEYVLMGRTAHIGIFSQPSENDYKLAQRYMKMLEIWHLKDKIITRLSGGQRQMASIARALCSEPKIVIFDEPTSALDFANQYKFLRATKELLKNGYTVVLATHNPDFALLLGGYVALVKGGGEVAYGKAEQIIKSEILSKLYDLKLDVSYNEKVGRVCCLTYPF